MKSFRYIILSALLIVIGVSTATDASAQRDPRDKKRGDSTVVRTDTIRKHTGDLDDRDDEKDSTFRSDTVRKKDGGDLDDRDDKKDSTFRPDTIRKHGDLGKNPEQRGRVHELIGFFIHNDSCRDVFLAQMSAEDAATFTRLLNNLKGGSEQLQALRAQLRAAHQAGDTAQFRAISAQLKALYRQIGDNHKAIAELLKKYEEVAMRVRVECGGRPHKENDGGKHGDRQGGVISPNPVAAGSGAVLTLNLETEANVGVTISDQTGTVLTIAPALLPAGQQQIALDVSALPRGMYLVQVQIGDKTQVIKLMIG